jgi:hypothetical protein
MSGAVRHFTALFGQLEADAHVRGAIGGDFVLREHQVNVPATAMVVRLEW